MARSGSGVPRGQREGTAWLVRAPEAPPGDPPERTVLSLRARITDAGREGSQERGLSPQEELQPLGCPVSSRDWITLTPLRCPVPLGMRDSCPHPGASVAGQKETAWPVTSPPGQPVAGQCGNVRAWPCVARFCSTPEGLGEGFLAAGFSLWSLFHGVGPKHSPSSPGDPHPLHPNSSSGSPGKGGLLGAGGVAPIA